MAVKTLELNEAIVNGRTGVESAAADALRCERGLQPLEKYHLPFENLPARFVEGKPAGSIDLGKDLQAPRFWRPFHAEAVASQLRGVPVIV